MFDFMVDTEWLPPLLAQLRATPVWHALWPKDSPAFLGITAVEMRTVAFPLTLFCFAIAIGKPGAGTPHHRPVTAYWYGAGIALGTVTVVLTLVILLRRRREAQQPEHLAGAAVSVAPRDRCRDYATELVQRVLQPAGDDADEAWRRFTDPTGRVRDSEVQSYQAAGMALMRDVVNANLATEDEYDRVERGNTVQFFVDVFRAVAMGGEASDAFASAMLVAAQKCHKDLLRNRDKMADALASESFWSYRLGDDYVERAATPLAREPVHDEITEAVRILFKWSSRKHPAGDAPGPEIPQGLLGELRGDIDRLDGITAAVQGLIGEQRAEAERPTHVAVPVPVRVIAREPMAFMRPRGDPWLAVFQRVEITNSSAQRIALNISLRLGVVPRLVANAADGWPVG